LLLRTNLRLLLAQLDRLVETPYFTPQLDLYIGQLREIPRRLLETLEGNPAIDSGVARYIANALWSLSQFLTGSTTKQIPYEVAFAVTEAVSRVGINRPPGVGIFRPLCVAPKGISKHPVDGVILPCSRT